MLVVVSCCIFTHTHTHTYTHIHVLTQTRMRHTTSTHTHTHAQLLRMVKPCLEFSLDVRAAGGFNICRNCKYAKSDHVAAPQVRRRGNSVRDIAALFNPETQMQPPPNYSVAMNSPPSYPEAKSKGAPESRAPVEAKFEGASQRFLPGAREPSDSPVTLCLIGATGAGKSSLGNILGGIPHTSKNAFKAGSSVRSETFKTTIKQFRW